MVNVLKQLDACHDNKIAHRALSVQEVCRSALARLSWTRRLWLLASASLRVDQAVGMDNERALR